MDHLTTKYAQAERVAAVVHRTGCTEQQAINELIAEEGSTADAVLNLNSMTTNEAITTMRTFDITMTVKVTDPKALLEAAIARAMRPGPTGQVFYASPEAAREELTEEDGTPNFEACIQELLDPGVSPAGLEIEECTVEAWSVPLDQQDGETETMVEAARTGDDPRLMPRADWQTQARGTNDAEYEIYRTNAESLGWRVKSYDEWLNS
ncbi:hypothetical protein [Burkholderia gladioli]|uniref:hypothetical protein n=1 Tax=Burkholderia gladioli TaxID=28095 RepID=UPI00164214D2|nr:hypothetical protein [Burkholderia gladioli]